MTTGSLQDAGEPIPPTLRVPTSEPPNSQEHEPTPPSKNSGLLDVIEMGRIVLQTAQFWGPLIPSEAGNRGLPADQPISFRRLAKLKVLPMGASSMWRAAAIYRLAQKYPELYSYKHLGVAHLASTLRLNGPLLLAVLRRAENRQWSRRRLESRLRLIAQAELQGLHPLREYLEELLPQERPELPMLKNRRNLGLRRSTRRPVSPASLSRQRPPPMTHLTGQLAGASSVP